MKSLAIASQPVPGVKAPAIKGASASIAFAAIVSSKREVWKTWVKEKIDAGRFDNRVLKHDRDGQEEIDLSEMTAHLSME